ncbi:DEAD/DEAH box helicase [Paenibacillus sp. FSL R7-0333]|uniref:DEAD/DEAH box helicase n=1 Tax=Paenibacillus sp. FSL R7-0333 TaxID=1926587 RepID=UPI00268CFB65
MDFTLEDIKDFCGDTFYKRGRSYYNSGQVTKLVFDAENNRYTAQVKGSKTYRVKIDFYYHIVGVAEVYCTCPAYENYDCCKHVAATLIAIYKLRLLEAKEGVNGEAGKPVQRAAQSPVAPPALSPAPVTSSKRASKSNYQQTDLLISSVAQLGQTRDREQEPVLFGDAEQLQFEFFLNLPDYQHKGLTLEMRVGYKHRYVVTKLGQFLEHLEQRKPFYFTMKFTFDAQQQQMNVADREFLEVMLLLKKSEKLVKSSLNPYYSQTETDERTLTVAPLAWDKLKPLLSKVNVTLRGVRLPEVRAVLADQPPPLEFSIGQKKKKEYILSASELDTFTLLPDYSMLIKDGLIHELDRDTFHIIALLQQHFKATGEIAVAPAQIGPVMQQVLPVLRKLGEVRVEQSVHEQIVEPELKAKLYLDYADGTIMIRLEFHYEDIVIHPLEEKQGEAAHKSKILIRDFQQENTIIAVLDQSPLRREGQYWASRSEPAIYDTLFQVVPALEDHAELFISTAVQELLLERKVYPKVNADLNEGLDWLEISFGLEGLDEQETVRVMQAIVEKKKYIRLRSGAFLQLEGDRFSEFGMIAERLNLSKKEVKGSRIHLPSVQALQLPERGDGFKHTKWGKSLREFLEQLRDPERMEFELPDELKPVLRDYQAKGFQWMKTLSKFRFGGILADDMGLGKTIQSIAYICSELAEMPSKVQGRAPVLILCPASLTYNWSHEFARFAPAVNVLVAEGQKEERSGLLEGKAAEEADVIITSYPLLRRDIDLYSGITFHALILDEAQAIKNSASQTAKAVQSIQAARKFALTGTPIENSVDELEAIFSTVFPALFTGRLIFKELPAGRIASIVSPFILRRLKKEVLEELPDRIDTVLRTELLDEQKQVYLAYLSRLREDTKQDLLAEGFHKSRIKILAGITRLRQICCHPSLFIENYTGGSGKLEQLLETVKECRDSGRRMLVFSQFSSMLALIRHSLEEAGVEPLYLDGSTPGKERVELCKLFNEGEGEVFLISLKAGGTGLNLTGADTVILYDLWWNPAVEEQAIGRAHRMGQRNVVQVIRLITEGSIEEKMLELQQRKKDLIEEIIEAGENKTTRLSEEDIRELLRV